MLDKSFTLEHHVRTDWPSIFGLCAIAILLYVAISLTSSLASLFSLTSFIIVIGGTLCIIILSASSHELRDLPRYIGSAFFRNEYNIQDVAVSYLEYARYSYNNNNKDLAVIAKNINAPIIFQRMIGDIEDNLDVDDVINTATQEQHTYNSHFNNIIGLCHKVVDVAPAMGLIGTLIGLVQLLGQLQDPEKLGPAMALALLTTLYGAMLANILFLPISRKLVLMQAHENIIMDISMVTARSIAYRENPRKLETRINSLLVEQERVYMFQ